MGEAGESRMTVHQQKKLDVDALQRFRDRFALPIADAGVRRSRFFRPSDDSAEMQYLRARRARLGGALPARRRNATPVAVPPLDSYAQFALAAQGKEMSTTMAAVRLMSAL
jgi:pyruvate dehydrogenase E1 component